MEAIIYHPGEIIAKEGQKSECLYLLRSGRIGVFKNHLRIGQVNVKGAIFGEVSRVLGERHTATLISEEKSEVVLIRNDIDEIISKHPKVAKEIMVQLAIRLTRMNDLMSIGTSSR